jgi:bacteriorhodopsin
MRASDIKFIIYIISLGAALVAYGHSTFSTKHHVKTLSTKLDRDFDKMQRLLERVDDRLYRVLENQKKK